VRIRLLGLLLLAGCGGSLMSASHGVSPKAPDDVYACAQAQLRTLGYRQTAHDDTDRRLVGEKVDPALKAPSGLFRRGFHRLEITIRPDASGNTTIDTKLQTFMEYASQQGLSTEEERVPERARADERQLIAACTADTP
jgi:hypothetical protein